MQGLQLKKVRIQRGGSYPIFPIKFGTQTFDSTFYVMDIHPSYSCLLGQPWIHNTAAVTSTLHQMLKYPVKGKIITVHGEEEYMISHLNSFRYVEVEGYFAEIKVRKVKLRYYKASGINYIAKKTR